MAQDTNEYGKIFPLSEAIHLFGDVKASFSLKSKELLDYCSQTDTLIMFGVENGTLYFAGRGRKILLPVGGTLAPEFIMRAFYITKVEELLNLGNEVVTEIEIRSDVLDLKNGEFILEYGTPCPPFCG